MACSEELVRMYDQLCDLCRYLVVHMKSTQHYDDLVMCNGELHPLLHIAQNEGLTQAELSQWLHRTKGATSSLVNKLEGHGLIKRVRSDTRCFLHLTEKGRKVCNQSTAYRAWVAERVTEALPVDLDDLETTNRVMSAMLDYCKHMADQRNGAAS